MNINTNMNMDMDMDMVRTVIVEWGNGVSSKCLGAIATLDGLRYFSYLSIVWLGTVLDLSYS